MNNSVADQYISSMPGQVGALFYELWQEVVWLQGIWDIFVDLFGRGQERVDLLNESAPAFFKAVGRIMRRDVFLGVARITDPGSSGRGGQRINVSLHRLLDEIRVAGDDAFAAQIESQLQALMQVCVPIRDTRNRILAHSDLATALGTHPDPIPGVTKAEMEEALKLVRSLMNDVEIHYRNSSTSYEKSVSAGVVTPLINALEEAKLFRERADE